jgi:PEP-CTERM motif
MKRLSAHPVIRSLSAAALAAMLMHPAFAATQSVTYSTLAADTTVPTTLNLGDNLFIDTFTTEHGALSQRTTFTLYADADFTGLAGWIVDTANGQGPRLVGVNIDIIDADNNVVASDTFTGVLGGFAHSDFSGTLAQGVYTVVATGNALRDASLDISLSILNPVPEPATYGMLLGGFAVLGALARRRR